MQWGAGYDHESRGVITDAGWLMAELLSLTGVLRSMLIIRVTMPVAVFNYLLAIRYRRSPK